MWQEIIVYIIGILTLFYIGMKVYGFIHSVKQPAEKNMSVCSGCSGCRVKSQVNNTN